MIRRRAVVLSVACGLAAAPGAAARPAFGQPLDVDLATATDVARIEGTDDPTDFFGFDVASCDVNGDGIDDLLIGAPQDQPTPFDRNNCGRVAVFYGRRGGWAGTLSVDDADVTIWGRRTTDDLGWGLACGDIDGDGIGDLVLSARYADRFLPGDLWIRGVVHVIFGRPDLPPVIDFAEVEPDLKLWDTVGLNLSAEDPQVADVNGDGFNDLLLDVAGGWDPTITRQVGRVYLVWGRPQWPALLDVGTDADVTIFGADDGDFLQTMTAGAFDADGIDDFLLSAAAADGPLNRVEDAGEVYLFRGRSVWPSVIDLAIESPDMTVIGAGAGDLTGRRSLAIGDLDLDGTAEMWIGVRRGDGKNDALVDAGELRILERTDPLPPTISLGTYSDGTIWGETAGENFGSNVLRAMIAPGGQPSLVATAYWADYMGRVDAGRVSAYEAPRTLPFEDWADADPALRIFGAQEGDELVSRAVADLNDDGLHEVVLASAAHDQENPAKIWLVSPYDLDGDGINQLADNCPLVFNADQADADGDRRGDACAADWDGDGQADAVDCAPADASAGTPEEVGGVRVEGAAPTVVTWDAAAFAEEYDVARGFVGDLAAGATGACVADDDPADTRYEDPEQPPAGRSFFYLVRGRNPACPASGPWGAASDGTPRAEPADCP
ncbi:MAG: hypothetical protein D6738_04840 [Acidobacteria bacterium]|nr:MAG: hypothetical protein D6738_04840 [Acidobacteriota bacterium]